MSESTMLELEPVAKLNKDLKLAAKTLGRKHTRYLVDVYYQIQHFRITSGSQARAGKESGEPNNLMVWTNSQMDSLEKSVRSALNVWSDEFTVGRWLKSICGIGPVIASGLLAHLDITRAKTYGHFWSFAGLNPDKKWEKKTKRPWNPELKTLVAFKAGECFVKVQGNKNDYYGKLFRERRDLEEARNNAGGFASQAAASIEAKNYRKTTTAYGAYSSGKLPDAHLHARARRFAVKVFLAHVHHAMYLDYYGQEPPPPYPMSEHCPGDHRHYHAPPNLPFTDIARSLRSLHE